MSLILTLIGKYWQYIAIAILCTVIGVEHKVITGKNATIATQEVKLKEWKDSYDTLNAAVDVQNKSIQTAASQHTKDVAAFADLQKQLVIAQTKSSAKVNEILTQPKPTTCQGAIDYLVTEGQKRK